jgi:cyanophycinase
MGALVLAGSGEFLPIMRAVDEVVLGHTPGSPPRVAIVPTASGQEGPVPLDWIARGVAHFTELGCDAYGVPILGRADADDAVHVAALIGADFVYLSGGNPAWLVDSLRDTAAWRAILAVRARGGTIAGSSAGAMALCGTTPIPRFRDNSGRPPEWRPALGLAPGLAVLPHYDRFGGARSGPLLAVAPPDLTILGIDEDTVVMIVDGTATVLGRATVTVWRAGEPTIFAAGETIPAELVALP